MFELPLLGKEEEGSWLLSNTTLYQHGHRFPSAHAQRLGYRSFENADGRGNMQHPNLIQV